MTRKLTVCLLHALFFIHTALWAQNMSGTIAPSCHLNNAAGDLSNLAQFQDHYVLLHFWNGDNAESLEALQTYSALEQDNADKVLLFSVFFGTDKAQWEQLVQQNQLDKNHACILEKAYASSTARDYHITAIPRTLLVDKSGVIVADNPSLLEIKQVINDTDSPMYGYQIAPKTYEDGIEGETVVVTPNPDTDLKPQYRVLLGNFGSLLYHNGFKHLQNLGTIEADMLTTSNFRVWIGPTEDYQVAQYALIQSQKARYVDAKIVTFLNGQPRDQELATISNSMIIPNYADLYYNAPSLPISTTRNDEYAYVPPPKNVNTYPANNKQQAGSQIQFQPPVVVPKPVIVVDVTDYSTFPELKESTSATSSLAQQENDNNSNTTNASQGSLIPNNPTKENIPSSRVTPTDAPTAAPAKVNVSHVVRVSAKQGAYTVSNEQMEKRGELKESNAVVYDPYAGESAVEPSVVMDNPYQKLLSSKQQKQVARLEKKQKKHKTIAEKAEKKARDIERKALLKNNYQ